jgi:hypothetical protein
MALVMTNPAAAARLGIPQSVAAEFVHADKGRVKKLPEHKKKPKKKPFGSLAP